MSAPFFNAKELTTSNGAVILGPNQFLLLLGLLDRPGYQAESSRDLVNAAIPYRWLVQSPSRSALKKSIRRLNPLWITRQRKGRYAVWTLTPRGVDIVERTIPSHITGVGRFIGVRALRAQTMFRSRGEALAFQWKQAAKDISMQPILEMADRLVKLWRVQNRAYGMADSIRRHGQSQLLERFIRSYVLRHCKLPTGKHAVQEGLVIDFTRLIKEL